jgi:hypothetical protein
MVKIIGNRNSFKNYVGGGNPKNNISHISGNILSYPIITGLFLDAAIVD